MTTNPPPLPCPQCQADGIKGGTHIGNRRAQCNTCNAFAQAVLRHTRNKLKDRHPIDHDTLKLQAETDLYRKLIINTHGETP